MGNISLILYNYNCISLFGCSLSKILAYIIIYIHHEKRNHQCNSTNTKKKKKKKKKKERQKEKRKTVFLN